MSAETRTLDQVVRDLHTVRDLKAATQNTMVYFLRLGMDQEGQQARHLLTPALEREKGLMAEYKALGGLTLE